MQHTDELPATGILEHLTPGERAALFAYGDVFSQAKGEKVVVQGDPHAYLHLVLRGELRVAVTLDDGIHTLGYVQPGECVGEMSLLEPVQPASANVIATADARLWCIQRDGFDRFVLDHPAAGAAVLRGIAVMLARRLRRRSELLGGNS